MRNGKGKISNKKLVFRHHNSPENNINESLYNLYKQNRIDGLDVYVNNILRTAQKKTFIHCTVCPRSLDLFYMVTYYIL